MDLNKIYNENCLETMARMEDNFIDLVVTSPPYDDLRTYNGYTFEFEPIAKELYRVIKHGGILVWIVGDSVIDGSESGRSYEQALYFKKYCGFKLHDTMIYWKNSFAFPESNRYAQNFEFMFVFSKDRPKTTNIFKIPTNEANRIKNKNSAYRQADGTVIKAKYETGKDERNKENIWIYDVGYGKTTKDECYEHPAMFPEQLAADHIFSWSKEGDLIYDPFMGSGTVAKMAHLLKRNWIGSEISKEYVDIAEKRIWQYLAQQSLF